jgi:hypothetical protein
MSNALERVEGMLGFNPSKKTPASGVLAKVLDKVRKDREAEAEAEAEKIVLELIAEHKKITAQKKEFDSLYEKSEKLVNKLLGRLQGGNQEETPAEETVENPPVSA